MPDAATDTAMHGHVNAVAAWARRLERTKDREDELKIMQQIGNHWSAYMVLAARERDDG